ncbi:transcription termination/antitermination protein NusG [Candidatus Amesbacteria bacterium RIFCSPHIGHO2_01_FULL_48_32]|uniref:Transcription termination/antitermination protein NusG n=1 Tax=Candidatus Amesbacteria bacterium RIFCSPLOWO2_01_FULL_48_25 TaxID=1797259 RepID=A0A1F4ZBT8_9BACT|nr:MAG: transcription termination/antitermination protein NusG [Candidatus Amesbacteria bacterium RIFCSPHIGHO2_01_FULL_48_32]OGD03839.1 MAG: transcription termination/antitermination protein NusG [Candidatus Amesbacteria bacterium RIFCSPLOWO2_01_FULL_48_25]
MIINSNVPDSNSVHWYVVHTYSGHEARVADALRQRVATLGQTDKVFELLIPTQNKIHIKHGKKFQVREKIFPGYLLVKMIADDDSWLVVRTTQGITGFVGMGNKPTPLSQAEVDAIMQFAQMGAAKFKTNFTVGEAVKITDGPFTDFLGSIESLDEEHGKLRVLVSIFGRETPVELDFLQVKKI